VSAHPSLSIRLYEISDLPTALETLIALGIDRVLTSGGAPTAVAGAAAPRSLVAQPAGRITILAGGGVRAHNLRLLLAETHVTDVHLRAMQPDALGCLITVPEEVGAVLLVARDIA
jgi:copper homeostasis protein CutC